MMPKGGGHSFYVACIELPTFRYGYKTNTINNKTQTIISEIISLILNFS
jgi:hypothetical protein